MDCNTINLVLPDIPFHRGDVPGAERCEQPPLLGIFPGGDLLHALVDPRCSSCGSLHRMYKLPRGVVLMKDINGVEIKLGDIVHCWDGGVNGRTTASFYGTVNDGEGTGLDGHWHVDDNPLALVCAEFVEVIYLQ